MSAPRLALACVVACVVALFGVSLLVACASRTPAAAFGPCVDPLPAKPPLAFSELRIGRSREGRPIDAYRFGAGLRRELIIGGVHGAEFGQTVARQLLAYLRRHPGAVASGHEIDIVPALNPDGIALHERGNAANVDLNRNLPTRNWRRRLNPRDPSSLLGLSGGRSPASEPETRALVAYLRRGFRLVVSLHSRGGFLDYNGPGARRLAERMSRLCGLPVQRISYQGAITGSLGEYVPAVYRVPVVTVELRSPHLTRGLLQALVAAPQASSPP